MRLLDNIEPQHVIIRGEDGQHHKPHLDLALGEGESSVVLEIHEGDGTYQKSMDTNIVLKDNAHLTHIRIQNDSVKAEYSNTVHITMARDSRIDCFTLNLGGKVAHHDVHAILNGAGAECTMNSVNLLKDYQHGNTIVNIEHVAPYCKSEQFYRSVLDDEARGVFQGKIHVHKSAQKTDGYQLANTILLSPAARMNTRPELEIYADDVKCSHGTTTGALNEDPLFYLRSRGLSENQARILLIQAFVDEVIDKISYEPSRVQIKEMAEEWLKTQL